MIARMLAARTLAARAPSAWVLPAWVLAAWVLSAGIACAQAEPEEIVIANAEFTLWHQAARAATAQNGFLPGESAPLPVYYALHAISLGEDALDVERLLLIAETWLEAERSGGVPPYFSAAGLDGELARRIICYVAGEGPGRAHALLGRWGPPRDGANCQVNVAMALEEAAAFYDAYLHTGISAVDVATDGSRDPLAEDTMAFVRDILSAATDYPDGLHLRLARCGRPEATYADDTQTVTLCTELMDVYRDIAARLAAE